MRDAPRSDELLDIARQALQQQITPQLDGGSRHAAMMVANALGIVARQLRAGSPQASECAALEDLLGHAPSPPSPTRLEQLNRELTTRLRQHGANAALDENVYRYLLATTRSLVEESNPKYLQEPAPPRT